MKRIVALISMLHEKLDGQSAATRLFRGEPVLSWTLRRLGRSTRLAGAAVLCWDDQVPDLMGLVLPEQLIAQGERQPAPRLEAISAAQRWAEGWRGGLLSTTCFDVGFDGQRMLDTLQRLEADAAVLVNADAGLIDPALVDSVCTHALEQPDASFSFVPAAPGLGAMLIRRELLLEMVRHQMHPGQLLSYLPDLPGRDPIARLECAPLPVPVARSAERFVLDSQRQIERLERASAPLNGQLIASDALALVRRIAGVAHDLPREIVVELTPRRQTSPIHSPAGKVERPDMTLETARKILHEARPDVRILLGGVGDPLEHPQFTEVIRIAREAGARAIAVETDLLGNADALAQADIDVVLVHLPATSVNTYRRIMGVDALSAAIENLKHLVHARGAMRRGLPLVVPAFVKCRDNLHEMEVWYDHWMRTLGCAVISGPATYGGLIEDVAAADMSPPGRVACRRLSSRMVVLSDGRVVACEQDARGELTLGHIQEASIGDIWKGAMAQLRKTHEQGNWDSCGLCGRCREWHRP